jgi:hypothetical protein
MKSDVKLKQNRTHPSGRSISSWAWKKYFLAGRGAIPRAHEEMISDRISRPRMLALLLLMHVGHAAAQYSPKAAASALTDGPGPPSPELTHP